MAECGGGGYDGAGDSGVGATDRGIVRDEGTKGTRVTEGTGVTKTYFLPSYLVTAAAQKVNEYHEIDMNNNMNNELINTIRIGGALKKMRFKSHRQAKGGKRGWLISLDELIRWSTSYGLDVGEITGIDNLSLVTSGTPGTYGTPGTPKQSTIFEGIL